MKNRRANDPFFAARKPARPYQNTPDKKGFFKSVFTFFSKAVHGLFFLLGAMTFMFIISAVFMVSGLEAPQLPKIPESAVLYVELQDGIAELPSSGGLTDAFAAPVPDIRTIINAIDTAKDDPKIKALAFNLKAGEYGFAHMHEIRQAVGRFKQSKKPTYIYSISYGDMESGLSGYYLASAFDQIWMQPMGIVAISGIRAELPYFKPLLDKIGVKPDFIQKKEFKTAYEPMMRDDISPQQKIMLEDMIGAIRDEFISALSTRLQKPPAMVQSYVDAGLFTSQEALQKNLITHTGYDDEIVNTIHEAVLGTDSIHPEFNIFISPEKYNAARNKKEKTKQKPESTAKNNIALVYVNGMIVDTLDSSPFANDDGFAAGDTISDAIKTAADDETISAIVVRIDSPGGSPSASETILRSILYAKHMGKKVIVSMGPTAASGGYWVATHADQIYAMPTTLTGSIGVIGGKFSMGETFDKLSINWNKDIAWGKNAGMWSFNTPFSPSQKQQVDKMMDFVYDNFIDRVAKGRNLQRKAAESLAKGRVWTGTQAKQYGLVDELGGLHEALDYTAQQLGYESQKDLEITIMPRPRTLQEEIADLLSNSGLVYENLKLQSMMAQFLKPYAQSIVHTKATSEMPIGAYQPNYFE